MNLLNFNVNLIIELHTINGKTIQTPTSVSCKRHQTRKERLDHDLAIVIANSAIMSSIYKINHRDYIKIGFVIHIYRIWYK